MYAKKAENSFTTFHGTLKSPESININNHPITVEKFSVLLPYTNIDNETLKAWKDKKIAIRIEEKAVDVYSKIYASFSGEFHAVLEHIINEEKMHVQRLLNITKSLA